MTKQFVATAITAKMIHRINQVKPANRHIDQHYTIDELLRSNYINQFLNYTSLFLMSSSKQDRTKYLNKCAKNLYILGFCTEDIDEFCLQLQQNQWPKLVDTLMQDKSLR